MTATLGALAPLGAFHQFVLIKFVPLPNGKTNKLPFDWRTGAVCSAHNPAVWLPYAEAVQQSARWPGSGIGFVLTASDPFWCVDIDAALQSNRTWSPLALALCSALPGAVVEVSHSGTGLHIWGRGPLPPHGCKNVREGIELYDDLRFIALGTGAIGTMAETVPGIAAVVNTYFQPAEANDDLPSDGPREDWAGPRDDDELIRRALASQSAESVFSNGTHASFRDLWERNDRVLERAFPGSDGGIDESSADASLAQHLAFWTGCDADRIARLMKRSGLVRSKFDREDYLPRTIRRACSLQRDVLRDKPRSLDSLPSVTVAEEVEYVATVAAKARAQADSQGVATVARVEGSTYLDADAQVQLFAGCCYVMDQHKVLVPGGSLLKPDQFKAKFGGYVFALDNRNEKTSRDPWEAFTQSQILRWPRADGTCFEPSIPYGSLVDRGGVTLVNIWWPAHVPMRDGDPQPFLEHLRKLLPDERDRLILLSYLAACVQRKGHKFQWAPVLIGVEGNGKTLLSVCAAYAVGDRYVHWPSADKLDKQFNGWMYGKLLYCVEDMHTSDRNIDVLEKLKPMITASRGYEIERKGVDQFSARIVGNFIFNSNHRNAVRKTRNDRRMAVLFCAQQSVEDLERDGMAGDYVKGVYDWLEGGGFEIVAKFLATWEIPVEFDPTKGAPRAPKTSVTEEAILASLGTAEQEILEAIANDTVGFRGGWVSSHYLDELLRRIKRDGAVPLAKRRILMQSLDYDWHPALSGGRVNNMVLPDGAKPILFVKRGHEALSMTKASEIAAAYSVAQGTG